jgi:two-component system, OmpR family, phosphate regulon sensor histidine kinase PhoR
MMEQKNSYRKNFALIPIFILVLTVFFFIALFFGFKFTQKQIESEFSTDKVEILEGALKPYNELVFNKIPQISLYQGFLDAVSIRGLSGNFLRNYPLIRSITFYDIEISNQPIEDGFRQDRFSVGVKAVYNIDRKVDSNEMLVFERNRKGEFSGKDANDFSKSVIKFVDFINHLDTNERITTDQIFKVFYTFNDKQISFINVPREADLKIYHQLLTDNIQSSPVYEQDLLTFYLDPKKLPVINTNPYLYEKILIRPVTFDSLSTDNRYMVTGIAMPGAFSDYQLYCISSKDFVNKRVWMFFTPIAIGILVIYLILVFIAVLIYRNMNVNSKLFKLQYDFINNLTHEFKTPVSVIKIAANNIKNKDELSANDKNMYGKILDEEADKLNDLMNKLLSLTQLENKSIKQKKEKIDLYEFCQDIVDAYHIKYPDFNIEFSVQNVLYFESDRVLLYSLFQNLIDNAYKYSYPDRKKLQIKIRKIKNNLIFLFIDEGIGIPKKDQENIFNKFYRVENQFNQQGSAGIGLAFCKEVVKFMNGEISVKSEVGKGSEFKIVLPIEN